MSSRFLPSILMMGRSAVSKWRRLAAMTINCRLRLARSPRLRLKPDSMLFRFVLSEKSIACNNRPTVLALTSMPWANNSPEIDCVVFLVQRVPSIGSPATSSLRISWIFSLIVEFFFRRSAATARPANTCGVYVLTQQLDPTLGDRMRIDPEQGSHSRISPSTDLQRLQPRKQPSLLFIEQSKEQDNRCFHLVRQHLLRHPSNRNLRDLASRADLPLAPHLIQGEVDKGLADPLARDQLFVDQLQQALSRLHVQSVVQLVRRISRRRLLHKALAGVQQGAVAGKPDAAVRPQTTRIKLTGGSERVILAAMGVARQIRQLGQFPEHSHSGGSSQSVGQLFKRANGPLLQDALQILSVEHGSSHNGTYHH